jgi:multicomponent K+:H+ antiporter subunit D
VLGTLNMADLSLRVAGLPAADLELVRAAGLLLCLVFALKAALAPLHLWLPGAYTAAGPAAAAIFAIMTKVGAYSIARVYTLIFGASAGPLAGLVQPWLLFLGLVTIVVGSIGVLAGRRLALVVSHLVVVSAGTLLTAFGIGGSAALTAGLFYMLHSTLVAAALFLLTDNLANTRGIYRDRLVAGPLLPAGNLLGGLFLLLAVAVAGLPPLSGFLGKLMVLQASLASPWMTWILAVILVTSLLTVIALARAGSTLFFKTEQRAGNATLPNMANLIPVIGLAAASIVLVVYAGPIYTFTAATAAQLLEPAGYIAAVLGNVTDPSLP